jgi:hypothetical protein
LRIQSIIIYGIGLIVVGMLLHAGRPYVPSALMPIFNILDSVFVAVVGIVRIILELFISILNAIKSLLPR